MTHKATGSCLIAGFIRNVVWIHLNNLTTSVKKLITPITDLESYIKNKGEAAAGNTNLFFDIKNSNELFSFLNTKKISRRKINNVLINFDYDFSNNVIKFNNAKIDNNKVGDQILNIIEEFEDNNSNNKVKTKRLLNNLLDAYEG